MSVIFCSVMAFLVLLWLKFIRYGAIESGREGGGRLSHHLPYFRHILTTKYHVTIDEYCSLLSSVYALIAKSI